MHHQLFIRCHNSAYSMYCMLRGVLRLCFFSIFSPSSFTCAKEVIYEVSRVFSVIFFPLLSFSFGRVTKALAFVALIAAVPVSCRMLVVVPGDLRVSSQGLHVLLVHSVE